MNFKINYNLIIFLINFNFLISYFNFVNCYQDDHLFSFVQEFKVRRSSRFSNLSENLHSRLSSHHHLDFLNEDDDLPLPRRLINNFKSTTPSSFFNQYPTTRPSFIFSNYNNNNRYNNNNYNYNSNFNSNYNRRPSPNYPTTHADYDSVFTTYRPYRPTNKPVYKPSNIKPITSASIASSYVKPTNVKPTFNQPTKPAATKYIAECACKHRTIGSNSLTTDSSISNDTSTFPPSSTNATIVSSNLKVNRLSRSKDKNYVNLNRMDTIPDTRIVNGTIAQYYKYPWTVSLGRAIDGKYTNESHYCGATLIAPQWILSAGHCLTDFRPKKLIIAFGSGDRTKMTHFVEAEKWVVHPEFSGWPKYLNDIALVKLKEPVLLNGAIKPACLHSNYIRLNKEFEAIGWGRLGVEDEFPTQLQKTKFNYVTTYECKNRWSKEEDHPDITPNNICVYNPTTDICGGDSGSPLQNIAEDGVQYVVGVASFTNFCDQSQPAVYVRVYPYIQWIVSVVKNFC